jgi:transcriptional regulator with XRE-family HTH domain
VHYYFNSRPVRDSGFTIADEMPRKKKEDSSFGPRLAALRKARGFTQVQLAEATKTTQRSISYYENDDGVPPSSIVMVLAQALQVSADELLGLKPAPKAAQAVAMDDDPETRRLWKRFQMVTQLPEKDQRAVIRLINSLAAVAPRRNGSQEDHDGR